MNQILATENKRSKGSSEIKNIVMFFAIFIMLFGLILLGEGCFAIYKNIEETNPSNIPFVTVTRVNDEAIIKVTHNAQIMKITYSWDNGEENVIPINAYTCEEAITLLGYNSTLNLTVEDMNGKRVTYHKQYLLDNMDITKPVIEIETANGSEKMTITATDETEIAFMSYKWSDSEEEEVIYAETEGQKEIKKEINLTPGTRTIAIFVQDANGNTQKIEKEIITTTSKPTMKIITDKDEFIVEVEDKDGVKDIVINLNGVSYAAKDINQKKVQVGPLNFRIGNNTISIEVTNVSGYTQTATTELQYTP